MNWFGSDWHGYAKLWVIFGVEIPPENVAQFFFNQHLRNQESK
ncbi:hypothetical protein SAMN05216404_104171 [Nitrosospira multiformis]|uniref:Uncharacterized protein n=1 Tax=Nitrosospira multiformis TaxID=1231 RepID=A0A1H8GED6_9PROT|nr:hypothetical protein SAMN05216404_104171 [Nitrosospira multiformis]